MTTPRTTAICRALTLRGYSEMRPGPDYRRWRISPTHARRIELWCARRSRWLQGDIFLLENGRLMLGATRQLCLAVPQITVDHLLHDGHTVDRTGHRSKHGPVGMTLEELLAP